MRPRLCSFELAWTDAAFDAIYPERDSASPDGRLLSHLPHGVASMHPARFFDSVLASVPFEQWLGLRATLWMIALAPLFTIRRLGTIASIAPADRARVLDRLIASPTYAVRQLAMSFKAIATMLYVQSDVVRAAMSKPLQRAEAAQVRVTEQGLISAMRLTARRRDETRTAGVTGENENQKTGGEHEHAAE